MRQVWKIEAFLCKNKLQSVAVVIGWAKNCPKLLTCPVELWRQTPKESRDLIRQYTKVNVYC